MDLFGGVGGGGGGRTLEVRYHPEFGKWRVEGPTKLFAEYDTKSKAMSRATREFDGDMYTQLRIYKKNGGVQDVRRKG